MGLAYRRGSFSHELRRPVGDGTGSTSCIWALTVLPDGCLVSGGSEGQLQFWDGVSGTLLQGFQRHQAPLLAVAASAQGDTLFTAGVDERIDMYRRTTQPDGV